MICSKPVNDDESVCLECRKVKRYFDKGYGLLCHDDVTKKIIYGYKFAMRRDNAFFLGWEMSERFSGIIKKLSPEAMIPIPLHKSKLKQRGFNQAQLLAEKMSQNLKEIYGINLITDSKYLLRKEKTKPQKELNANQRIMNMKGAFEITEPGKYKRVLLIDDIFTSGSTLNEAAKCLKAAGADKVFFLTVSIVC